MLEKLKAERKPFNQKVFIDYWERRRKPLLALAFILIFMPLFAPFIISSAYFGLVLGLMMLCVAAVLFSLILFFEYFYRCFKRGRW